MNIESRRVGSILAPSFSALANLKKKYIQDHQQEVIDFSIGSSNIPPADAIKDILAQAALEDASYQYTLNPGDELIAAVQKWYQQRYDTELEEKEIAILKGSQEALSHIPMAFLDEDDLLLLPDPHYPIYSIACSINNNPIYEMPLKPENDYLPELDQIPEEVLDQAKMILVSYPNNPTGACAPDSFYEELIDFARKNNLLVVHDNAYSELLFSGKPGRSFLSFEHAKEVGIELNSLSKSYSLGGARFAVMVGNADMIAAYRKLLDMIDFGGFAPVAKAAVYALENEKEFPKTVCQEYKRRRDVLIEEFEKVGWKIEPSQGTMFVWAPVPDSYQDSMEFTIDLLNKAGILVHPGTNFGSLGKYFVRLALVRSDQEVKLAAKRIAASGLF
ncbi:aminotransferase class I/II-fold pyridoxal phosphate-dependent enzyme [Ileibacterium valens]|uniref:aminotransferase class I/II-fold pyridoxal phosphate-dependent enzyme n=1 Tax=Ileibacterium valens TaxID=1862668 RepID=UPI003512306D